MRDSSQNLISLFISTHNEFVYTGVMFPRTAEKVLISHCTSNLTRGRPNQGRTRAKNWTGSLRQKRTCRRERDASRATYNDVPCSARKTEWTPMYVSWDWGEHRGRRIYSHMNVSVKLPDDVCKCNNFGNGGKKPLLKQFYLWIVPRRKS